MHLLKRTRPRWPSSLRLGHAALLLALALTAPPASAAEVKLPVPGYGTLVFDAPDGWGVEVGAHGFGPPYQVRFGVAGQPEGRVLIRATWLPDGKSPEAEAVHASIAKLAEQLRPHAQPDSLVLTTFPDQGGVVGSAVSLLQQQPGVAGHLRRTSATAIVDKLMLLLTALSGDDGGALGRQALAVLQSARHLPEGPPATPKPTPQARLHVKSADEMHELFVPASPLRLLLPKAVWRETPSNLSPNSLRYFLAGGSGPGAITISGWMEPAANFTSVPELATDVPDSAMFGDRQFGQAGAWSTFSYVLRAGPGEKAMQQTYLRAHRRLAGTWIELRLSVLNNESVAEQRARLIAALDQVQVIERR
jgi:hypothetical protein